MEDLIASPELYALLHRGTPGDEAFYLRACDDAGTVLEFGCGHGRLMLPLALAGHRVTGIDRDEGLLKLARSSLAKRGDIVHRTTLHHGDMRTASPGGHFDRIIIPYNGLYCLASEAEQVACLANAARHLSPGGRVVFDAYVIDAFHFEADEGMDEDNDPVASIPWRGTVWNVFETCGWDRPAQCLKVRYRYQPQDDSAPVYQHIDHRYLLTEQLPNICETAGLRIVQIEGGFQGEPFNGDSEHLVCIAQAA